MSRDAKVMKLGDDQQVDQAVYIWFKQKRMEGVPISGPLLCEKVLELIKCLNMKRVISVQVKDRCK